MRVGNGRDACVALFIKDWKALPPEKRKAVLERARYDVYKPGSRAIKLLVGLSCCVFILAFGVFVLFPLLWFENILYGFVGAVPVIVLFPLVAGLLRLYLIRDRLKTLIDETGVKQGKTTNHPANL